MSIFSRRVAAKADAADLERSKQLESLGFFFLFFWMSLQMLNRAQHTMSSKCRLERKKNNKKAARASCSYRQTKARLPAWVRANSKASLSNFQFTTAHNSLQQPNFIFCSQIRSHIILYIALES